MRGIGGLYTTEIERTALGDHGGRSLTASVERRSLQLALGRRRGVRLTVTRLRPVAIGVRAADGRGYELPVDAPPDPWLGAFRRLLLLSVASFAVLALAPRMRRRGVRGPRGPE